MTDERFDYVRTRLQRAVEDSAEHITWVIAKETGKHIGNEIDDVSARERLIRAIEDFLK